MTDVQLLKSLLNLSNNLGTVSLGRGLYKVRTPKIGRGKSSGFRTLVVFKKGKIAIFVYGFSKNEKNNLHKDELGYFKKLANDLLAISEKEYLKLENAGAFFRVKERL